jgi:hypothetical protein
MPTAIVTCSRNGVVIKEYHFLVPETLDDSRMAGPNNQELIDQVKSQLTTDGLSDPTQWGHIKFTVSYAS